MFPADLLPQDVLLTGLDWVYSAHVHFKYHLNIRCVANHEKKNFKYLCGDTKKNQRKPLISLQNIQAISWRHCLDT